MMAANMVTDLQELLVQQDMQDVRVVRALRELEAGEGFTPETLAFISRLEGSPLAASAAEPDVPSPAAIDEALAGATNDQLASLMAQSAIRDPLASMMEQNVIPALNPRIALTSEEQAREWNARHSLPSGGGGEILDPWADAPDMSGGRQGLRASQGIASQRAGAQSAGAAAMAAGKQASQAAQLAELGAANEWMKYGGLAAGLAGTALGVAAPFLERDEEYEAALAQRASGDTVARKEMDYAAGQMRRNIMGSAMGRRDISPALAMRNAQMAQSQATSQMMARAAMASAQERQMAQNELAQIRKQRTGQAIDAGLAGLSQLGAFASTQYASQKQDALGQQKLQAYQDRTAAMRR